MATTTNLNTLTINYLTQAQFDALETKDANQIYLTPDNTIIPIQTDSQITGITASTTATKTSLGTATSIYGVQSNTTTASKITLGTPINIYGVKSGTNSTVTASKASGSNGIAPTLGEAINIYGVKSGANSTTTASKASGNNGTAASWTFGNVTVANSISGEVDSTDNTQLNIVLGTTTVQSKTGGNNGSASTWSFTDITVPIRADNVTSIPNVTSVGSASTWSFTDVAVPIRADNATSIPNVTGATDVIVPIKNTTTTVVPNVSVTSATVSITDPGHTHTLL